MRLFLMALRQEQDVVLCRNHARSIAAGFHFSTHEQIRIATAVSEIARNAFRYANDGTAEFGLESDAAARAGKAAQTFVCTIRDRGKGISHLEAVLGGTYRSETGLGMGIIGARRLMDRVEIDSTPQGTTVRLARKLPAGARVEAADLRLLVETIGKNAQVNPLEVVAEQNRELLRTLEEVGEQREEVAKINDELTETNRGVVALYDELDTVYRVGRVVASKLDLESLMQAITDATTEVSGAEFGAFYHRESAAEDFTRQAVAGRLKAAVENAPVSGLNPLFGGSPSAPEVFRVDDFLAAGSVPNPLGSAVPMRSYLAVPVADSHDPAAGCLVFAHSQPGMFTERSERILASVAVQASIGLENARLYHSVQSASAAKDQFLAMLSHELRTPLNPVFAVLASLEENPTLSDEVRAELLVMRRNLQLEARLIDDLLDLTRIVKGKVPLQLEVVNVHGIIRLGYETCMTDVAERSVRIRWQLDAARFHVRADAARLQQVFWNLLSNAVKFTPAGGEVTIRTETDGDGTLCVVLSDTGRGIDAEALKKIFLPFEQGDVVIPVQFGGLGLGLAITKSIVDAHGGEIRAESGGPGKGATFVVSLPLAEVPLPAEPPAKRASTGASGEGVRILLIDDHADTRTSLQRLLSRRGYQITLAGDCREALAEANAREFDLVISDLGLPDGTGHDLMRALRAAHGDLAGIALSGYGMETDIARSLAAGFAAHLTKPLDFTVLQATIEQTLAGTGLRKAAT